MENGLLNTLKKCHKKTWQFYQAKNNRHITVLNTRPKEQAESLSQQLQSDGFNVLELASIQIEPLLKKRENKPKLLIDSDIVIFISSNAVIHFDLHYLLSTNCQVAVIGKATAQTYQQIYLQKADIIPIKSFDSEGLLAHPQMQAIKGKKILIVRGKGGREHLAIQLQQRNAKVCYLEVYQRCKPKILTDEVNKIFEQHPVDFILVFSSESLTNLLGMVEKKIQQRLKSLPLLLIHPKIAEKAVNLGFIAKTHILKASDSKSISLYLQNLMMPIEEGK